MGLVIFVADRFLGSVLNRMQLHGHLAAAAKIGVGMALGVGVFFCAALALKMEELNTVLRRFKRRKVA
jgi:hypothetical protein